MTDRPLRKTLSLKQKKSTESKHSAESKPPSNKNEHYPQQNNLPLKQKEHCLESEISFSTHIKTRKSSSDHVATLAKNDLLLQGFQKRREHLLARIDVLEQRLIFVSSEPLQAACNELKKEDTDILCQINNYLLKR